MEGILSADELTEQKEWYDGQKERLERKLLRARKEEETEMERRSCFEKYVGAVEEILHFNVEEEFLYRELVDEIIVYPGQIVCVWLKDIPFGIQMRIQSCGRRDRYQTEILESVLVGK